MRTRRAECGYRISHGAPYSHALWQVVVGRHTRPLRFYRTPQNMRTSSAGFGPERHFAPVIVNGDCRGHILRSAKGFRPFDRDDHELGIFASPDAAVGALLARGRGGLTGDSCLRIHCVGAEPIVAADCGTPRKGVSDGDPPLPFAWFAVDKGAEIGISQPQRL